MSDKVQNINTKIVVATDKFKGSLKAIEAAHAISSALEDLGHKDFELFPMADGGDGSLDILETALINKGIDIQKNIVETVNPLGYSIKAPFLYDSNNKTAYIEMANISGLLLIPEEERNIMRSTTFGLGEVIRASIEDFGARKVVLMIGGSATNDAGFGLLTALGYRYTNDSVFKNKDVPTFLVNTTAINNSFVSSACPHLNEVDFIVATDVTNPLLGKNGATRIYAPQKGATTEQIEFFEEAIKNWSNILCNYKSLGYDKEINLPGAGAAGGIAFAMKVILGAKIIKGWELLAELSKLEDSIALAQCVITGEGRFDAQSLNDKLPLGILKLAKKYSKPAILLCGECSLSEKEWKNAGFSQVLSLMEWADGNKEMAFKEAKKGLKELTKKIKF